MSNLANLVKKQNFETFSFDYYSKQPFENEKSPYENMVMIYNKCKTFCENFDNETKGIVNRKYIISPLKLFTPSP